MTLTDTQSPTTESETTIDDAGARSRRSFIAVLIANRDVFSNLPERIEQWLEKKTRATNQPEATGKPGFDTHVTCTLLRVSFHMTGVGSGICV